MTPEPHITDHALLRWMERIHGIDVRTWRKLMVEDLQASLAAHNGHPTPDDAVFLLSPTGESVVSVLRPGQSPDWNHRNTIPVARVVA
jgi:hypothetical protein